MEENDQNDDYKFVEFDDLENPMDSDSNSDSSKSDKASTFLSSQGESKIDIKRNAIIALGVVVVLMVLYKIIAHLFFTKKNDEAVVKANTAPPVQQIADSMPSAPPVINNTPAVVAPQPIVTVDNSELTTKVAAIELAQQNVRSEVGAVSQQVSSVNNNMQNLNNQIANLNQVINNLSTQLTKQTEEINLLMARTKPKPVIKPINYTSVPPLIYNIQAVIPGRAWIIGTNGSTLTVREGTKIPGYGVVKLIDPLEGRVVMNSGQVIRFSQEDS